MTESEKLKEELILLKKENAELKEVISELSDSMAAISDLSSHMKLAAALFAFKEGKIIIPARAALKEDEKSQWNDEK